MFYMMFVCYCFIPDFIYYIFSEKNEKNTVTKLQYSHIHIHIYYYDNVYLESLLARNSHVEIDGLMGFFKTKKCSAKD